eukprot:3273975-Prymnesium_polylepis.1
MCSIRPVQLVGSMGRSAVVQPCSMRGAASGGMSACYCFRNGVLGEDDTSSRTPSLHYKMKWYRFRTVKSKLHHRATPRAERGEESSSAGPASSSQKRRGGGEGHGPRRAPADVSAAASVRRPRTPS